MEIVLISGVEREEAGVDADGIGVSDDKDDDDSDVAGGAIEFKHRLQRSFW